MSRPQGKVHPGAESPGSLISETQPGHIPAISFIHDPSMINRDAESPQLHMAPARWRHKLSQVARKWPAWTLLMILACVVHSAGWPAFTRLTGYYFNAYKPKKLANYANVPTLFYTNLEKWICTSYALMGMVVYVGSMSAVMSYSITSLAYRKQGLDCVSEEARLFRTFYSSREGAQRRPSCNRRISECCAKGQTPFWHATG